MNQGKELGFMKTTADIWFCIPAMPLHGHSGCWWIRIQRWWRIEGYAL